jgi:hypothetical protein
MASPRKIGPYEYEYDLFNAFNKMKEMVEEIYSEREFQKGESFRQVKKEGDLPPSPPISYPPYLPPSRPPSSPPSTSLPSSLLKKIASKNPLLKLDVKFNLPGYNDEPNA